jgi:hypothetical protein
MARCFVPRANCFFLLSLRCCAFGLLFLAGTLTIHEANAQSLHEKIDIQIAAQAGGELAPAASDAEFFRRINLDLAGTIPTPEETTAFLADADAAKREKLIDRLLAAPNYGRHLQEAFSAMLLERRAGSGVPNQQWNSFLQEAFNTNRPWNELTRDLLFADDNDKLQAAKRFLEVDGRAKDPHQKTQDIARLFLGRNMKCAQCHDHPSVANYKQAEYFGLYSYLQDKPEQAKSEFESVFIPGKNVTFPRLPGMAEVVMPTFTKEQEAEAKAFRPRLLLARDLPTTENDLFKRNSVNRLWFLMFGRGLVNPLDLLHPDNPPSHPDLMTILAEDFGTHKFDIKYFLREIALSQAYQRTSVLPAGVKAADIPTTSYRVYVPKPLSPEQIAWSMMRATGNQAALEAAAVLEKSEFDWYNYLNGKCDTPTNIPDVLNLFVGIFGNPPGEAEEEFTPSMGHALFLMNERLVLGWLEPKPGNLMERIVKLTEPNDIAEQLSLAINSRPATEDEKKLAANYLQQHADARETAITDLAWAMLTADEFRMNH